MHVMRIADGVPMVRFENHQKEVLFKANTQLQEAAVARRTQLGAQSFAIKISFFSHLANWRLPGHDRKLQGMQQQRLRLAGAESPNLNPQDHTKP